MKNLLLLPVIATWMFSTNVSQSGSVYLSPASLQFGTTQVGQPPRHLPIDVNNTTNSSITLTRIAVNGNGFDVYHPGGTCGASLAANSSCFYLIDFNPNFGGAPGTYTGSVYVYDSASNSPQTASLTAHLVCYTNC